MPGMKGLARGIADMSTLSPKGQALVRAAQRAYQPTDADRERLLGALRAQLGDAALPADGFVIGEPVSVTAVDYDGNERRGLTARCRRENCSRKQVIHRKT